MDDVRVPEPTPGEWERVDKALDLIIDEYARQTTDELDRQVLLEALGRSGLLATPPSGEMEPVGWLIECPGCGDKRLRFQPPPPTERKCLCPHHSDLVVTALSQPTDMERVKKALAVADSALHHHPNGDCRSRGDIEECRAILAGEGEKRPEPTEVDWQFDTDLDLLAGEGKG